MSTQFFSNIQNKAAIRKREKNKKSKQYFLEVLNEVNWKHHYSLTYINLADEYFLPTFGGLENHAFSISEVGLKLKIVFNP